jgi:hypothetical protein
VIVDYWIWIAEKDSFKRATIMEISKKQDKMMLGEGWRRVC